MDRKLIEVEQIADDARDKRPESLADLLIDYDVAKIKSQLEAWNNDPPVGSEIL